jgi:hypothetical protein
VLCGMFDEWSMLGMEMEGRWMRSLRMVYESCRSGHVLLIAWDLGVGSFGNMITLFTLAPFVCFLRSVYGCVSGTFSSGWRCVMLVLVFPVCNCATSRYHCRTHRLSPKDRDMAPVFAINVTRTAMQSRVVWIDGSFLW